MTTSPRSSASADAPHDDMAGVLASPDEIIEDARNGRMFILIDQEDRENEGDLIIPAQFATPDAINFMAKHGRGLICLSLTRARAEALDLTPMSRRNDAPLQTAFTVSIEARDGVTTGISAHDRSRTIGVAIDPTSTPADVVTPGHVFPLVAREGGVLVRAGHTEAAVDISRLAGLNPAGVICEIMNDDGTMARLPDLAAFAREHKLKIGAISDLIAYRRRHDRLVERRLDTTFTSRWGGTFRALVYRNKVDGSEHLALVKGRPTADEPCLVRMHKVDEVADVLGEDGPRSALVETAMRVIGAAEGPGVIVFIRDPRSEALVERLTGRLNAEERAEPGAEPLGEAELRTYGVGAQILLDLGVQSMTLLTNVTRRIIGLEGYGLSVASTRPLAPQEAK